VRPRDYVPLVLLGGIGLLMLAQGIKQRNMPRAPRVASRAETPNAPSIVRPQGKADSVPLTDSARVAVTESVSAAASDSLVNQVRQSGNAAPTRDMESVRALIKEGSPGTYLPEVLAEQSQFLIRWPDRRAAMRVWIERDIRPPDWNDSYPVVAERAFDEWREAGFPLHFDVVRDTTRTDIRIRWVEKFPPENGQQIGVAKKTRDQHGWLVDAEIIIATHDSAGRPLPAAVVAGTARHEIGHALGLGHSSNATDVMFERSMSPVISKADRATLHLLYLLPPGVVK
jgi:predicted Zn-dependent protease